MTTSDSIGALADLMRQGLAGEGGSIRGSLEALFGDRYHKNAAKEVKETGIRDAYGVARADGDGVPYAGLINPDNPPSGPYGGCSVVWFPSVHGSVIGFSVGTRGLHPDEGILTRPGHRRRIAALRRYLASRGVTAWSKSDPTALAAAVPRSVVDALPEYSSVFRRYPGEMYCVARVPDDALLARTVVASFFDVYAYERGWAVLKAHQDESNILLGALRGSLFVAPTVAEVNSLLRDRRFVILQGPPGTGKTRLAEDVRRTCFDGRGLTIQFHPSVTYEDFVVGLAPDPQQGQLRFAVRRGSLIEAARLASAGPCLLIIDEVNRADLSKVLGEAIYLFEPGEVGGDRARAVKLPHPVDDSTELRIPENLFVLGTMNTADRSIASVDVAIRRRFAFVEVPPNRSVVQTHGTASALRAFDRLADVFVEHASDEALSLLPGHAYFLAASDEMFAKRLRYDILPLLDDYLRQGVLGSAAPELHAVRNALEDEYLLEAYG